MTLLLNNNMDRIAGYCTLARSRRKRCLVWESEVCLTSLSMLRFVADGRQMATFQLEGELRCRRQGVDTSERFAFAIQRSTREHEHIL